MGLSEMRIKRKDNSELDNVLDVVDNGDSSERVHLAVEWMCEWKKASCR